MPLTDLQIKAAKPDPKPYKLTDGAGLYVLVTPAGGRLWRLKYRWQGKEKSLNLGPWPAVGIKQARLAASEAKLSLAAGTDPGAAKQAAKAARAAPPVERTFRGAAEAWYKARAGSVSASTYDKERGILDRGLLPWLGDRELDAIAPPELLVVVRRIAQRTPATAARALTMCKFIWREAVFSGAATRNPALDLVGAVKAPRARHHAAQITPDGFADVLRRVWSSKSGLAVASAVKMLAYIWCRPGELVRMRWSEVDPDAAQWRYVVSKTDTQHIVPLSRQVVELLTELRPLTGHGEYVFKAYDSRAGHLSENTINSVLRAVGIDTQTVQTAHGFRASARTLIAEQLGVEPHIIEHQLAHEAVRGALGAAYNRALYLSERTAMMQRWGDYCDELLV